MQSTAAHFADDQGFICRAQRQETTIVAQRIRGMQLP
jgi:hypothetical protein